MSHEVRSLGEERKRVRFKLLITIGRRQEIVGVLPIPPVARVLSFGEERCDLAHTITSTGQRHPIPAAARDPAPVRQRKVDVEFQRQHEDQTKAKSGEAPTPAPRRTPGTSAPSEQPERSTAGEAPAQETTVAPTDVVRRRSVGVASVTRGASAKDLNAIAGGRRSSTRPVRPTYPPILGGLMRST
jgi:hypothetical protein